MRKILLLIFTAFSVCSFGQISINEKINSILADQVTTALAPGLTVGIVKDGELIYHNSKGLMNLEYDLPFNDSTTFELASVTKQFTSACIAILEEKGSLSVNDDVRRFIPELTFSGDTIRIKHLLNHTSGIRNHNVLLDLSGFDYEHRGYTNKMIQQLMFRQKGMNNKPGEKMLYSNTNYVLLALVIERVSGMPIDEFAKKELFDPLQMSNTFYKSDLRRVVKNRAYSYYKEGGEYKQPKSLTLCVGAGGVESTISDLAIWSQIFLDTSHKYSYISDFITKLDQLNNGEEMLHARGMFVTPYNGLTTFNHSGRDLGMRSQFICLPDLNLGVIVFANAEHINAVNVSYQILELFIQELPQNKNPQKTHLHSDEELNQVVGHYQELNSDLRMDIFIVNDTLNAQSSFGSNPVQLNSTSNNSFSRIDNASVRYTFLSGENSEADLLVDFGGALFYFEKIELAPAPNPDVSEYSGIYFSEELNVSYELIVAGNELILNYPNNEGLVLKEGVKDVFGANRRTKYTFIRDDKNDVISFYVASEGTVKDILFEKIN
ncbi:serine hydrolase domain-containing protein [Lewinella cohaerens]|uniref:serine hydrolase domain-containing protein n=1 Tax=Lewinella cohaerens TaxID=70995 RepID=UPI00037D3C02|nr:serine hydrolase domain-containing protein [Lewinella cohaerens]